MRDVPVALITGAAGGIGAATACEFALRGHSLALVDCDRQSLDRVIAQIRSLGSEVQGLVGDLADLAFAEQAVQEAAAHFGRIDVLVNGAIWREIVTMREISVESWERTLRVGLTTPAFLARWVARVMETRQGGVIVNVSSMMSQQSTGFAPAYVACKGGLESLTYDLAALYGSKGIRVVAISPGAIQYHAQPQLSQSGRCRAGGARIQRGHEHAGALGNARGSRPGDCLDRQRSGFVPDWHDPGAGRRLDAQPSAQRPEAAALSGTILMSVWQFADWIAAVPANHRLTRGEGNTPLVRSCHLAPPIGADRLFLKLESSNPTGSYKDRFAAVEISALLAAGKTRCVGTSSGNTGAALAAYCAAAGIACELAIVEGAPAAKLAQMLAYAPS